MLLQMTLTSGRRGRISVIHTPKSSISNPQFGTPPVNTNTTGAEEIHLKGSVYPSRQRLPRGTHEISSIRPLKTKLLAQTISILLLSCIISGCIGDEEGESGKNFLVIAYELSAKICWNQIRIRKY